ncbi:MAG: metallophosphoesterase family protein [Candidatus Brocadiia bacterium]
MLQVIISDIHSNAEAFAAVLNHIKTTHGNQINQIVSLGDMVGYGPNPVECIIMAMDNKIVNLYGNHELALFKDKLNFNPVAARAITWTRETVNRAADHPKVKRFFETLQYEYRFTLPNSDFNIICAHGSPRGVVDEYVIKKDDLFGLTDSAKQALRENFETVDDIGFLGHTHIPYVCTNDFYLIHPEWQQYEAYPLLAGTKTIVNAGSVGQPRDHDPRACYVTFDGQNVTHYRVDYPIDQTVIKIKAIPELDKALWMRLLKGT